MVPVTNTVLALLCKLNNKSASDFTPPFEDDEELPSFFSFFFSLFFAGVVVVDVGAASIGVSPPPSPKASLDAFSVLF